MAKRRITKSLGIILFTNMAVLVAAAMLAPIYAVYVEKIGGDLLDVGIAAALFAVAAGITSLVAGAFADKVRRKHFIVACGYLLTGVGFLGYLWVSEVWHLFIVQVFIGLLQASYEPVFDGLYTRYIGDVKKASSRWSLWEAGNYFSIAIGSFLGAMVVAFWSFDALFIAMAGLCFLSGLYLLLAGFGKKRS